MKHTSSTARPRAAPPTEAVPGPALNFCLRLSRANAVVANRLDRSLSGVHGIGFGDFMILYYLSRAPDSRLRRIDLAHRMELSASGVTRSLLPLEKRGIVSRQSDPRDARIAFAGLTPAGQRLFDDALVTAQQVSQEALQALPADRQESMAAVFGQLAGINLTNE